MNTNNHSLTPNAGPKFKDFEVYPTRTTKAGVKHIEIPENFMKSSFELNKKSLNFSKNHYKKDNSNEDMKNDIENKDEKECKNWDIKEERYSESSKDLYNVVRFSEKSN